MRILGLAGVLMALAIGAPAAEGRPAGAHSAAAAKLRLVSLRSLPASVPAGYDLVVRGRVRNLPRRRAAAGRFTFTLLASRTSKRGLHLRSAKLSRTRGGRSRAFKFRIHIPSTVRPGRYYLRACVRRAGVKRLGSCRTRALRVTSPQGQGQVPGPAPGPTPGPGAGPVPRGVHSLRAPVTGENFYFVMADRFENGDTANDHGGYAGGKPVDGYDPTGTGWYHGGDLKGLQKQIDYIDDLGATSIWLTPSFKNKAVQTEDNSAGYHGYWITDFTKIDPHLGTNADLGSLVDAAHARGMKVYFDIITNHTADIIDYTEAHRPGYVSKDQEPYRTAATGTPFDDRDYASGETFPAMDPATSFPYTPFNPPGSEPKVPAWLNDVTAYHNRGNTTFVGENSQYGDFFGLDDLFTEQPRVVDGMVDIYKTWIRDFRIDGFRIDTMKHVNDEFWQKFAPAILDYAHSQGKREFFLFGEVFDTSRSYTSHFTTHDRVQAVLDFPFQAAAQGFAASSAATDNLRDFFAADDWYTDADSNAYQLPTFLGNHDMGRIGMFVRNANPGAGDPEVFARDRLAHELMYFSRGNPVIYYGDEQGFVGDGGDQGARQDMFPSQVASYNDDDLIATDATTAQSNFDRSHPLFRALSGLADVTRAHPALRNGAQQHRYSTAAAGIYAFSRLDRSDQHEYVVALNNSEVEQEAAIPTWVPSGGFAKVYGPGSRALTSGADKRLRVTLAPLSAVVYRSVGRIPSSGDAPAIALTTPPASGAGPDRAEVRADVAGDSFYEVTFEAKAGNGDWQTLGTDDSAPYRVFQDVSDVPAGTTLSYRATVLDNAGHMRTSALRTAPVLAPEIALEAPADNERVRGRVEVRATTTPEHPNYSVTFYRQVGSGAWTAFATDDSSPVYTAFDDTTGMADGTIVRYRAELTYAPGAKVESATRSVQVVTTPVTTATVHYRRPAADYTDWGLHLWGEAIAKGVATDWAAPRQRDGVDSYGAYFSIPLKDDTKPVNFIVHRPSGGSVPTTQEPGGDRSFVPLSHPEIWLVQGDPNVYYAPPPP
jgi:glycosidase